MKFASFETIVAAIYNYMPGKKEDYGKGAQTAVAFGGGYLAGILCAIISHPADVMVSKLNADRAPGEGFGAAMSRIYGKIGFSGLWNGLPVRIVMIGTLTGLQVSMADLALLLTAHIHTVDDLRLLQALRWLAYDWWWWREERGERPIGPQKLTDEVGANMCVGDGTLRLEASIMLRGRLVSNGEGILQGPDCYLYACCFHLAIPLPNPQPCCTEIAWTRHGPYQVNRVTSREHVCICESTIMQIRTLYQVYGLDWTWPTSAVQWPYRRSLGANNLMPCFCFCQAKQSWRSWDMVSNGIQLVVVKLV